ncbi:MAG: hypothetical protein NVSMB46_07870 [Candidatus Saccharimonadales bacterium]
MDHFNSLVRKVRWTLLGVLIISNGLVVGIAVLLWQLLQGRSSTLLIVGSIAFSLLLLMTANTILTISVSDYIMEPLKYLWLAILHVSPEHSGTPPPNVDEAKLGRELITSLVLQVYQMASMRSNDPAKSTEKLLKTEAISTNMPLPYVVIDPSQTITFANEHIASYLGLAVNEIIGKNVYSVLDLSFPSNQTLDSWLKDCQANKLTATTTWERVRLPVKDQSVTKQLDLAASYSKNNTVGVETILMFFDHTERYAQDDSALSFVALAVHELRAPLTVLRGYIEVFEEEVADKLDPELTTFMHRMHASAEQLASFVSNILNVARIEDNQLTLQLQPANWDEVIRHAGSDMQLRAQVHNKSIEYRIAPGLPAVAVDRVSIYEVINNLLDNAIKYSAEGQTIVVSSQLTKDGFIETTIIDRGVGIPESIIPNLFEKFYRNHRTQTLVGGTGLGLFLSKSIVDAHGGQIWVRSKVGEGSTFGFTLLPYTNLADELKTSNNNDIVRKPHGWIKNHSMYRR